MLRSPASITHQGTKCSEIASQALLNQRREMRMLFGVQLAVLQVLPDSLSKSRVSLQSLITRLPVGPAADGMTCLTRSTRRQIGRIAEQAPHVTASVSDPFGDLGGAAGRGRCAWPEPEAERQVGDG